MAADPSIPLLTQELAHRLERVGVAFGRIWLDGVQGLQLGDFGPRLLVGCHPDRPELDFQNRVNGLTPADADRIPDVFAFYEERNVRPWWEIVPDDDFSAISVALTATGASQIGFHGMVYGRPLVPEPARSSPGGDVRVRAIDSDDDDTFATFARTRMQAHELPAEVIEEAAADLRGWLGAPSVTLLLAKVDGAPAATAALLIDDGIGYLADAATLPAYRRCGLQSLLIGERVAAAREAGCDLVSSQASFASTSFRNLQFHGLSGGFTKVVWR